MSERLSKALDRLADKFEFGHLLAQTDPAGFVEMVTDRVTEQSKIVQAIRLIFSKISNPKAVPDTCECDGCLAHIEEFGEKVCKTCGYKGRYVAIACACYDGWCSPDHPGSGCPHGALTCPVCQEGEADVDPWRCLGAIQLAMRGEAPEEIGRYLKEGPKE